MDKQGRPRRRPKAAGRSCSTCICGGTTGSTTGTWSISVPRTWSGATCSTSRVTYSTELARSKNVWERRTAIVSTSYFIRQGDLHDTFVIAEICSATTTT